MFISNCWYFYAGSNSSSFESYKREACCFTETCLQHYTVFPGIIYSTTIFTSSFPLVLFLPSTQSFQGENLLCIFKIVFYTDLRVWFLFRFKSLFRVCGWLVRPQIVVHVHFFSKKTSMHQTGTVCFERWRMIKVTAKPSTICFDAFAPPNTQKS